MRPRLVHIETFGCQMNEYDSELVRSLLKREGYEFTDDREKADVVLMNTCAIRESAHTRVYGHLAELRAVKKSRPLVVGVLGCMAQSLKSELTEKEPLVDVLVGPDGYRQLPGLLQQAFDADEPPQGHKGLAVDLSEYETYQDILPDREPGVNGWIAIMRGCDNFCTFCVVPYTRGRERSRDPEGILEEARILADQGHRQVTLLGQNVNSYRHGAWDFARLISAVADTPGLERVRFTSPHPKDFPPPLLEAIAEHPRICKHIHLPLQAGNDRVLDLMGRTYTQQEFLGLVDTIRRRHPSIALTTDIICGFPTETEEEFLDTCRVLEQVQFHLAYIFKYSERKNTIAARKFPDDVPERVKGERVARLLERQKAISFGLNQQRLGEQVAVLVEGESKRSSDQWMGRTDDNITVVWAKDLPCSHGEHGEIMPGRMVKILVDSASVTTLFGRPIECTG